MLKDDIMNYINNNPGATDTEIEKHTGKRHQTINQYCRVLEKDGYLRRQNNPNKNGCIGNYPMNAYIPNNQKTICKDTNDELQEEDIKHILHDYLVENGWRVKVAWGHQPGVDIEAVKNNERWMIEVKGPGSRQPMRVNYFIGILGETLQRMDDPNARYSIALPDMAQYRGLWNRLPELAKKRTTIDLILVKNNGKFEILK